MRRRILNNKPLIEAIFELRWGLQDRAPGIKIDPDYKILIGRIYDRVNEEYSYREQLPTATIPDEMVGYVVQHRFRKDKDKWPLIQIGPGIITLNDAEGYVWKDFEERISKVVDNLFEAYPNAEDNLKVNGLILRYIDAIGFNYEEEDLFDFLKKQMKMNVEMHEKLFDDTGVVKLPLGIDLSFSFQSSKPIGTVHLRFARGKRKDNDILIWETQVQSIQDDCPKVKEEIVGWVSEAHKLTDDWFFKIIAGELLKRFE